MEVHSVPMWLDKGQMYEVDDHVSGVIQAIREISPRIHVFWNEQTNQFDLVEHCDDHVQRLIFSVPELDMRVVPRLRTADHWRGNDEPQHVLSDDEDFLTQLDADNEALEAELDKQDREKIHDVGERLAWAGGITGTKIVVPRSLDGR